MIKLITPFVLSTVFLSSNCVLADVKNPSSAIKLMSTGEAMHQKAVKKVKTYSSSSSLYLRAIKTKKIKS